MRKTARVIEAILVACCLAQIALSQQQNVVETKREVLLSKDKPTIYLTFERMGQRKPVYAAESGEGVWLRLHNNTPWAINFCTVSLYIGEKVNPLRLSDGRGVLGLREGVEISPCHGVEVVDRYESKVTPEGGISIDESVEVPNPPVGYNRDHVFSTSWLPSGRSVLFSVPREHLAKRLAIYVRFSYQWETAEGDNGSSEPQHRVYFRASDQPEKIQTKTK